MSLKVIVLAIWAAVHPGAPRLPDAAPIAAAIETAVSQDVEPPVFGSREEDAAVMAYYAIRESWLTHDAIGDARTSRRRPAPGSRCSTRGPASARRVPPPR
jgi:hypothetical protein